MPSTLTKREALLGLAAIVASTVASPVASAQSRLPPPDETVTARLVWSTLVALDNANRTGDYGVLHKLGSPAFQRRNPEAALQSLFADLRARRGDVGRVVNAAPTYYIPPAITPEGALRLRGGFDFRPRSVRFDLMFVQVGGGWRLHAISVAEMSADMPRRL